MRNYDIINSLGQGSFSNVFIGKHKRTSEVVVIKMEPLNINTSLLVREAKVYQYLGKQPFFPHMKYYGVTDTHRYLVMNNVGTALTNAGKLSHELVTNIGGQLLNCVKALHELNLVHRDIKLANILIKDKRIYLADFGFAKQIPLVDKTIKNIIGSPNFVSLQVHSLIEPTMRDDVESCIYVCMHLIAGTLPWSRSNLDIDEVCRIKQLTNNQALQYVRNLNFGDVPDYVYVHQCVKNGLIS